VEGGGGWGQEEARGSVRGGVLGVTPESVCGLSTSAVGKREREKDDVVRTIERGRERARACKRTTKRERCNEERSQG